MTPKGLKTLLQNYTIVGLKRLGNSLNTSSFNGKNKEQIIDYLVEENNHEILKNAILNNRKITIGMNISAFVIFSAIATFLTIYTGAPIFIKDLFYKSEPLIIKDSVAGLTKNSNTVNNVSESQFIAGDSSSIIINNNNK